MSEIAITYEYPVNERQYDPCFYVDNGHTLVAKVSKDKKVISIYCDGEMRINDFRDGKDLPPSVIRYASDLIKLGIESDELVFEHNESGRFDWVNNAWFDLYSNDDSDGDSGWLDNVTHDLSDAISSAIATIQEINHKRKAR